MNTVTEATNPRHARDYETAVMAVARRLATFAWDRPPAPSWFEGERSWEVRVMEQRAGESLAMDRMEAGWLL